VDAPAGWRGADALNRKPKSKGTRWVEDLHERKLALANGRGSVHGLPDHLAGWGMSEVAAA
jgi:hypothetical protein